MGLSGFGGHDIISQVMIWRQRRRGSRPLTSEPLLLLSIPRVRPKSSGKARPDIGKRRRRHPISARFSRRKQQDLGYCQYTKIDLAIVVTGLDELVTFADKIKEHMSGAPVPE